ncbi:MAG: hypothetical protein ACR2NR_23090 [Solirubrobacteraceae bacterium]
MKRLVIAAVLTFGIVAIPAGAGSVQNCGATTTVNGTSCKAARKVLDSLNASCRHAHGAACHVLGFACAVRTHRNRAAALHCTRGDELIVRQLGLGAGGPNGISSCTLVLVDDTGTDIRHLGKTPTPIDGRGTSETVGQISSNIECSSNFRSSATSPDVTGTVDMQISNPIIGSNDYSCHATGDFRCFGPRDGSNLRGWDLKVLYYVCIPDQDVKTLGRHLPGYCGKP